MEANVLMFWLATVGLILVAGCILLDDIITGKMRCGAFCIGMMAIIAGLALL